ncbi:MAG: ABC transporter ATP-binding protein, partial [Clostridia bacterium]|nr:ABC transporter ATP-binding protein [Clostridia bacterium]
MIEIKNLSFAYPTQSVFENISLTLPEAQILALQGASGSGKTTFLRLLMGLLSPQKGEIRGLAGRRVGTVFQEDRLLPWRTVKENITLPEQDPTNPMDAEVLLERLGLSGISDAYPAELSGGMQRRVAIARALYHSSDLLLMDEPFKGLDAELRKSVMDFCRERVQQIIFITHDAEETAFMEAETLRF